MMRQAEPGHGRPVWVPGRGSRAVASLRSALQGQVYEPGDDGYDQVRQTWKQRVDQRPALVARAWGPADVRTAVGWAGEHRLPVAVQSTGHGTHVAADGALLIKTSDLAGVLIDPGRRIARVGPGTRWSQVIEAAAPFGLVPLSGSSADVGVAGYTLGGGLGWLSRRYGFAADSLLRASVVTADAGLVTASRDSHPDLFWALRGGGGNFGVVTALEFQARPVPPMVAAGFMPFPLDQATDVLGALRDHMPTAPRELAVIAALTQCPPLPPIPPEFHGTTVLMPVIVYTGPADDTERVIGQLAALGQPIVTAVAPMPWTAANQMLDAIAPPRRRYYSKGGYLSALDGDVIDVVVGHAAIAPKPTMPPLPSAVQNLWAMGGAISEDFSENDTAFSREGAPWFWEIVTEWDRPDDDATFHRWVDDTRAAIKPHLRSNSYVNLSTDEGPAWRRGVWGSPEKYTRLVRTKTEWDPANLFRYNKNIPPAA
jgi:hypothetical protein